MSSDMYSTPDSDSQQEAEARYVAIPQEMKERRQWVITTLDVIHQDDGKPDMLDKQPFNARTGAPASTTDPSTWSTFSEAVAGMLHFGMRGIGFVFSDDDPYFGFDADHCRNPETGQLTPVAQEAVAYLATYTEVSTSQTGIHAIGRGTLPAYARHKATFQGHTFELYDAQRYFVMTGDALPDTPDFIAKRPEELRRVQHVIWGEAWHASATATDDTGHYAEPAYGPTHLPDATVLSRCRTDRNGDVFRAIYDEADLREFRDDNGEDDDSAADWYVLGKLAFYCGNDPDQIERLATQGQHYLHDDDPTKARERREKWQRPDPAYGTFIRQQIAKRLAGYQADDIFGGAQTPQRQTRFTLLSYTELANLVAPKSLIRDILDADCVAFLYGRSGRWKSFLALSWALAIAHGMRWMGRDTEAGAVVSIAYENANEYQRRIEAWRRYYGARDIPRFTLIPGGVHLLDAEHVEALIAEIKAKLGADTPVLVVIDTLSRAMAGGDENKTGDAQAMIAAADRLRLAFHCAVLFVHHTGHDQTRMRGNSVFFNDPDIVWKVAHISDAPKIPVGAVVSLTNEKRRSGGDDGKPILLTTKKVEWTDQQTGERCSSLVITQGDVSSRTVDAPEAPMQPPKQDFTLAQRQAWQELAKFCSHTPTGATWSQWFELATSKGWMVKTTFRTAVTHLREMGWVVQQDKRYRAANPYDRDGLMDEGEDDDAE